MPKHTHKIISKPSSLSGQSETKTNFDLKIGDNKDNQSVRLAEEGPKDYEIYNFKDSGNGKSWLIGTDVYDYDVSQYANAFKNGTDGCPEVLNIPRILTDSNGKTKIVEIIGRGAFIRCGCDQSCASYKGKTKRLKVPRQVKIIKFKGLAGMHDLLAFTIEAGSKLETIEEHGLNYIGVNTAQTSGKRTATLIIPSTLSSVYSDEINQCNLFNSIIYCGFHHLTNESALESSGLPETVVKVTCRYPSDINIFGQSPSRNSQSEADTEFTCSLKDFLPTPPCLSSLNHSSRSILALVATLLPSTSFPSTPSIPSHSFITYSHSIPFIIPFS